MEERVSRKENGGKYLNSKRKERKKVKERTCEEREKEMLKRNRPTAKYRKLGKRERETARRKK